MLFSCRNFMFLVQTWSPGWAPGLVWTQKMLFSTTNELLLVQTWTLAVLLALCGHKRGCSQAGMSWFKYKPGPWLGSWPCADPKEAVLKQK